MGPRHGDRSIAFPGPDVSPSERAGYGRADGIERVAGIRSGDGTTKVPGARADRRRPRKYRADNGLAAENGRAGPGGKGRARGCSPPKLRFDTHARTAYAKLDLHKSIPRRLAIIIPTPAKKRTGTYELIVKKRMKKTTT